MEKCEEDEIMGLIVDEWIVIKLELALFQRYNELIDDKSSIQVLLADF